MLATSSAPSLIGSIDPIHGPCIWTRPAGKRTDAPLQFYAEADYYTRERVCIRVKTEKGWLKKFVPQDQIRRISVKAKG